MDQSNNQIICMFIFFINHWATLKFYTTNQIETCRSRSNRIEADQIWPNLTKSHNIQFCRTFWQFDTRALYACQYLSRRQCSTTHSISIWIISLICLCFEALTIIMQIKFRLVFRLFVYTYFLFLYNTMDLTKKGAWICHHNFSILYCILHVAC